LPLTNHPENRGEIHEKMVPYGRKENYEKTLELEN
jgi:hypothetical protein